MDEQLQVQTNQYLTFTLGDERFAIEIGKVREVLDYTSITKVPRMPEFMRGVINLRGNVVPVIDLRLNLGMTAIERAVDTCIVIVEIDLASELMHVGMLADSVQEVIDIDDEMIEPAPTLGTRFDTNFIKGMGKRDDQFIILLDIDKVMSREDMAVVESEVKQVEAA